MRLDTTDIGMNSAAAIAAAGIEAIRGGDTAFDLSSVRTCDSSAVAVVLEWQRAAKARGLALKVSGAPAGLVSLATVYGVEELLPSFAPGR